MQFEGKTVLITGAATGIGRSLAIAFAGRGADLALLDIDTERAEATAEQVRSQGRRAEVHHCDATQRESVEAAVAKVFASQGPVALACANAGVMINTPLLEMEERDIDWVLRVNLLGVLDTARAYVSRARGQQGGGHLLLTGSENSVALPHALRRVGIGFYGMTKHAVLQMAEVLRYELAADAIGVSVLMPGPVQTEIGSGGEKRPQRFGGPRAATPFDPSLLDPDIPFPPWIPAEAAARIAIEGLEAGRFMIPTHSHLLDYAQARLDELSEATRATRFEDGT